MLVFLGYTLGMPEIEAPPMPYETMAALRAMGYKFPNALADVVDNSIDAGAKNIDLYVMADSALADKSHVLIMDDGKGMTGPELIKAMTLGSSKSGTTDLGKFGMGMKTASLSQCDLLMVASVKNGVFSGYSWDMDLLQSSGRWLLNELTLEHFPEVARAHLKKVKTGTVVMWTRLRAYRNKAAVTASRSIEAESLESRLYLSTVFHRHLAGKVPGKKIKMLMNQRVIVNPWDPYCATELNREVVGTVHLDVENASGVIGRVTFNAVLLPSQDRFSSSSAFHQAAGVYKWNDMQGFYFYRNDRLVDFGGWSHMRTKDEKSKFLRIAVDYTVNPAMDEEMNVNVSKQTASIPAGIKPALDKLLREWIGHARSNYSQASDMPDTFREKKYSLSEVEKMLLRVSDPVDKLKIKSLFIKISQ